jgi:hypothetical protein
MRGPRLLTTLLLAALSETRYIVPGGRWHDTDGNLISAHAGGIVNDKDTGKFWWFGEYKTESHPEGGGVSVYSSSDLATWEFHGLALGQSRTLSGYDLRVADFSSTDRRT